MATREPEVSSYSKNLVKYSNFYTKKAAGYYIFDEVDAKHMFIEMSNSFNVLRKAFDECPLDSISARCGDLQTIIINKITNTETKQSINDSITQVIDSIDTNNDYISTIIYKCHIKRELELARWENKIIGDLDNYTKRKDILSDTNLSSLFGEGLYDKTTKISVLISTYLIPQIQSTCADLINNNSVITTKLNNLATLINKLDGTTKTAIQNDYTEFYSLTNTAISKSVKTKQTAYLQIRSENVKYLTMITSPASLDNKCRKYWDYLLTGKNTSGTADNDIADCYLQFKHDVKQPQNDPICEHHAEGYYKYYVRTYIRKLNTSQLDPDFLYMYQTRVPGYYTGSEIQ